MHALLYRQLTGKLNMTVRELTQIQRKCKRLGISYRAIAVEASVTRPMVSLVFLRRATSRNVTDAALRLITKFENGQQDIP